MRGAGDPTVLGGLEPVPMPDLARTRVLGPDDADTPEADELQWPDHIGRYEVLGELGAGGMGVVLEADDPKLDRRVAIKLLRPRRLRGEDPATSRMLREARVLAALAHPNVVEVYEAGLTDGGLVFIAMELVRGSTLREWLDGARRSCGDVLDVFEQAGRGLLAAHEAGIVHRDFKPANVLIGDDGRVRVMDFGLARPTGDSGSGSDTSPGSAADSHASRSSFSSSGSARLTRTGFVMGTPAYMAPEQDHGETVDARADQFSFCVALYEALYGVRPFAGSDRRSLAHNRDAMVLAVPLGDRGVARWVRRVVVRGLAADPGERHVSMATLLDELRPRRRSRVAWMGGAVLAGGLAMTAWAGIGDRARAQCRDDAATRTLLEPSDTAAIEASFGATGRPFSADAAAHATARLHELDATWREARVEACDAGPLLDARLACLDDRRGRTQAIVARLRDADAELVGRAFRIVEALPTVADCARVTEDPLAGLPEPTAEQVQRLTLRLAQAEADLDAGHHDEGLATARSVRDAAAQIEHPPLHARADLVVGSLLAAAGEYGTSAEDLERAYFVAEQAGDDVIAFEAAARLVTIVGNDLARPDDGRTWARHAEAACDRMGRPRLRRANLLSNLSRVEFEQGHYDEAYALVGEARQIYREHEPRGLREARATLNIGAIQDARGHLDEAIATYEDAREMFRDIGAKLPEVATVTNNLGIVRSKRGEPETGLQLLKSALQLRREIYGEDHPEVAAALGNVGIALRRLGRYDEALETMEATTVAFERIHGPDHPMVASAVFNEGTALHDLGRDEAAKVKCERGVEIWERTLGPEHPMVANGIAVVAIIHNDLGDPDEALRLHNRALDIRRKVLRPDHPDIALSLGHIGTVYQKTDRCAEAIPLFEQQEIATVVSAGDDSGSLAFPLTARGYCEVELRRYEAAVGTLERALALRPEGSGDPAVRAETLFHLARARWAAGDDRDRARALATEAAAAWAQAGPGRAEDVTMARAWLAAHR